MNKKLTELQKTNFNSRTNLFHLFKGHKKEFEECTPCKHIMHFMIYEWKHGESLVSYGSGQIGLTMNSNPLIGIVDDWAPSTINSTTTTTLGSTGEALTEEHIINAANYLNGTNYPSPPPTYNKLYPTMTINPEHKIMVVASSAHSITHAKIESPVVNTSMGGYSTCTTYFQKPKVSWWKSHTTLCDCGEITIKWIP